MAEYEITHNLRIQRNVLTIIVLILILSTFLAILVAISRGEKVIIVPTTNPDRKMIYSSKEISDEYLISFSLDSLHLLLDISPETVELNYKRLLKLTLPENRQEIVKSLREIKEKVEQRQNTTIFFPDISSIRTKDKEVIISGKLKTLTYNTITAEEKKEYLLRYEFKHSQIFISEIKELIKGSK